MWDKLTPGAAPKIAGMEAVCLDKLGYETEVVTIIEGGIPPRGYRFQEFLEDVTIRYLSKEFPPIKTLDLKLPLFTFFSAYHLASPILVPMLIKRKEYDMSIAHTALTWFGAYALWRRAGIPFLNYDWDPLSYILPKVYAHRLPRRVFLALLKLALSFDKFRVMNSPVTVTSANRHARLLQALSGQDIKVVYPGCFPIDQVPQKRGDYLLALDRWDPGNLPHFLLDVLERLNRKVKLLVAGFWWPLQLQSIFMDSCRKKGLEQQVEILGPVDEERLKELFLGARAFIHPSEEPVSMPALDAAAHGCPIVMPEASDPFTHRVNAFFPSLGDVEQFSEYVDKLVCDERMAWRMGFEAWKVARENSWQNHAESLERIIRKNF